MREKLNLGGVNVGYVYLQYRGHRFISLVIPGDGPNLVDSGFAGRPFPDIGRYGHGTSLAQAIGKKLYFSQKIGSSRRGVRLKKYAVHAETSANIHNRRRSVATSYRSHDNRISS